MALSLRPEVSWATRRPARYEYHTPLSPERLTAAQELVSERLQSMLTALRHYQRHGYPDCGPAKEAIKSYIDKSARATTLDELRGFEGMASRHWFQTFPTLLPSNWSFPGRVRRPPTDPINALLSLGYTLLTQRITTELQARGLEVALGTLHDLHPGRPSLACDLVEPFRIPGVDRWVLRHCQENTLSATDFETDEQGGVRLKRPVFGRYLASWEQHQINTYQAEQWRKRVDQHCSFLKQLAP